MSFNEWSLKVPEEHCVGLITNDYCSHSNPKSAAQGKIFCIQKRLGDGAENGFTFL